MVELCSWENCVAWMDMIKRTDLPFCRGKKIVLTHNGFYYDDAEEAKQESNQITEESMDKIKRCAEDIMLGFERTKRYAVKQTGSYTGKHIIEHLHDYYTTNGEFVLASFCSGLFTDPQEWLCLCNGLTANKKKVSLNIILPMRLKKVRH